MDMIRYVPNFLRQLRPPLLLDHHHTVHSEVCMCQFERINTQIQKKGKKKRGRKGGVKARLYREKLAQRSISKNNQQTVLTENRTIPVNNEHGHTNNPIVNSVCGNRTPAKNFHSQQCKLDSQNKSMKLINMNFQSINNKLAELHEIIENESPDIIVGTETWLCDDIADGELISPESYEVYREDRNRKGGGVLIAVSKALISNEEKDLKVSGCEIVWAKIKLHQQRHLLIGSYYRRDKSDEMSLVKFEESLRMTHKYENAIVVVAGDFNFPDWNWQLEVLKQSNIYPGLHYRFKEFIDEMGFVQKVLDPTRGDNTLDLILTNHPNRLSNVKTNPGVSDHLNVSCVIHVNHQRPCQKPRTVPCYGKANWEGLRQSTLELSNEIMTIHKNDSNVESIWSDLKTGLKENIQKYIPHKTLGHKKNAVWLKPKTLSFIKKRNRLHSKVKKSNNSRLKNAYQSIKKEARQMIRKNYKDYMESLFTPTEHDKNTNTNRKKLWSFIASKQKEQTGISPLKFNDELVTDDLQKANILNAHFQSTFSSGETFTEEEFEERCNMSQPDIDQSSCNELQISTDGVRVLLEKLNPSKASGPDGLAPRVLKEVASELAPSLALLYQTSLDTGQLPTDWKMANVTPIYKKGDRNAPQNYRPISLTSVPCKILEHIIVSTIMGFCEKFGIICPQQHGFRRRHSCETQLIGLVDDITYTMDNGGQEDLIVLDFSKAFDKVNHSLLVHKLNHYGIQGKMNKWIMTFLANRKQVVIINGEHSTPVNVQSGVPQGSVLGPILFLLYINDLPNNLSSSIRLFADDTACHYAIKDWEDTKTLQEDLDELEAWERKWKMEFHPGKCSTLHISRRHHIQKPAYFLHGQELKESHETNYLGVAITSDLKWNQHIRNISNKANKTLGFLKRNIKTNDKSIKLLAYKALVRPIIEYASSVWDPYTIEEVNTLERCQKRAARWVTNAYSPVHNSIEIVNSLGLDTLQSRRKQARLSNFYKFHQGEIEISTRNRPHISTSRRSTRLSHSDTYMIEHSRTTYRQATFFPRTIKDWNALPGNMVITTSHDNFMLMLRAERQ